MQKNVMQTKPYRTVSPVIVQVDETGAHPLTKRGIIAADRECLMIIYTNPTLRQARVQFWMSCKMFASAFIAAVRGYFGRVNRSHDMVWRTFKNNSSKDRS